MIMPLISPSRALSFEMIPGCLASIILALFTRARIQVWIAVWIQKCEFDRFTWTFTPVRKSIVPKEISCHFTFWCWQPHTTLIPSWSHTSVDCVEKSYVNWCTFPVAPSFELCGVSNCAAQISFWWKKTVCNFVQIVWVSKWIEADLNFEGTTVLRYQLDEPASTNPCVLAIFFCLTGTSFLYVSRYLILILTKDPTKKANLPRWPCSSTGLPLLGQFALCFTVSNHSSRKPHRNQANCCWREKQREREKDTGRRRTSNNIRDGVFVQSLRHNIISLAKRTTGGWGSILRGSLCLILTVM